jgi:hypothetical protein
MIVIFSGVMQATNVAPSRIPVINLIMVDVFRKKGKVTMIWQAKK